MIKWADKLYFSNGIKTSKRKKLMRAVEKGKLTFELYSIVLPSNTNNLLDIINVNELMFPYYQRKDIYIIGLADSKEEAKNLTADILVDLYKGTGDFKVKDYFFHIT